MYLFERAYRILEKISPSRHPENPDAYTRRFCTARTTLPLLTAVG